MDKITDLVLDIAGVISTNFSPILWEDLSSKYKIPYDDLIKFRKVIRKELWTGRIDEKEFWIRFSKRFPTIDREYAKNKLLSLITPLPAIDEIPMWSKYANIHLLSNHRIEWVKHIISPIQEYITTITISGDVGFCKPQVDIYLKVKSHFYSKGNVLFVDDQLKNLSGARNIGWNTLLADAKGEWIKKVSHQLFN
ncbi:HAD family hydrolase [Salipaludibacillus daqingensis]|uniref:HAD family hydrolase n=1 Tax=Salipaludibacillus daqingensis TaxID=3041001 RepID=UPI00247725C0|nr:HAD-IA family hydrolase [Salipaludibacillus daqingensis]